MSKHTHFVDFGLGISLDLRWAVRRVASESLPPSPRTGPRDPMLPRRKTQRWVCALLLLGAGVLFPSPNASAQQLQTTDAKDSKSMKEVVTPMFRTGEVQLNTFGVGGVGHDERDVTETRTETHSKTITQTTVVTTTVLKDIPGIPGLTPVSTSMPVATEHKVREKKTVRTTHNAAAIQGGFGGLGAEAKYFATENLGLGAQGEWLDGESSVGTAMGTVTVRFPMGSNAPYLIGGAGVQYGDRTQAVGEVGGGLEHRFSPSTGIFADCVWLFGEHEDAAVFRLGASFVFGPAH